MTGYIYKNRIWNRYDDTYTIGFSCVYFTPNDSTPVNSGEVVWIYHNTCINGGAAAYIGPVSGFGYPNLRHINNLQQMPFLTSGAWMSDPGQGGGGYCGGGVIGAVDYNWYYGSNPGCSWVGSNNVPSTSRIFNHTSPPTSWIPSGSALGAAIDISKPFTLNGVSYPALPGFSPGYPHDMGAVQSGR